MTNLARAGSALAEKIGASTKRPPMRVMHEDERDELLRRELWAAADRDMKAVPPSAPPGDAPPPLARLKACQARTQGASIGVLLKGD